jgi:hypothetical protein
MGFSLSSRLTLRPLGEIFSLWRSAVSWEICAGQDKRLILKDNRLSRI